MKGGIQGLKVSHISFVLIGLVCVTVLTFALTKTTWLTSFIPSQNRSLQLDLDNAGPGETLGGNNNSVQTWKNQTDSLGSPGISEKGNIEDVTTIDKGGETPASVVENTGSEEVSQRKNKSNQADKPYVETDETGNSSTTTGNKESFDGVIERTGSDELSHSENKSEQVDIAPESTQSDETRNLTAATRNKAVPSSVVEKTASDKHPKGKNKSKEAETVTEDSSTKESSVETEQTTNSSATTSNKDCNYAKGKWVFDDTRPLYSGSGCKQWLSSMWACRLTQRTDFDYEKLVWQPKGCKPEPFTSSKFLQRMQHKTLAFIGDSLGRQQFQSLMCMATGGEERIDIGDVGPEYGLVKARGKVRPDGWAYRFSKTNTTILYYWSASLSDLVPIDPTNSTSDIAMNLDRPPEFLRRFIHKFDVVVLNTGHHWNRGKLDANRWVMYVGGNPNTDKKIADIGGAKNYTVHSIVKWVDLQMKLYPDLKVFFRTISPRHFFNGDWNTGGTCDSTVPRGKEVVEDESRDSVAAEAVKGTGVVLLDITGFSELRDEGHISRYSIKGTSGMQDCLHWCLPGIPDAWNEILYAQI